ncbi:hypothetical protein NIES298_26020 [Microcystis aeruginosa NIES-298]|uniref:hypothetical protein n=1 Tax=Microcystis aeruginosa TaxID=1126 RepID=UPI000CB85F24|nr:hypothetical protein [Microcystis aeruginosa]GBE98354.1 hypothetical protein NIES298_26020 [Microcystis aeruginosa NIES-298]
MKNRLYLHLMANREKGFALPLAVLIGLILMVTGITMMMRAQGDQSKVIAQKARADALRSSEAGVTRVQDLLNSVRFMATVDSNCTSGNCWERACSNPNDADTLKAKIAQLKDLSGGQWSDLGNNRYYRVVGYNFDDTNPPPDGLGWGVLTLEGRSRTSAATDLTNTGPNIDNGDNAASRNRVVVTIPILASPPPPSGRSAFTRTTVPTLWISEGEADDGVKFQGDVVESPGCNQTKIQQPTPAPNPSYTAQFVGVSFPDLPWIPGLSLGDLTSSETFPRTDEDGAITDTPSTRTINGQSLQVYEYIVDNINLSSGKITITPGKRVVFYVKGNINGAIEHDCSSVTEPTVCKSGNLQIYADGSGSTAPQICLKGDQRLEAFIFAPDYSLGKTGTGTFIGAAWGKNWGKISDCASNSGAVAVTQGVEWTDLIQDLKPQFPQLDKIANWCEEPIPDDGDTPTEPSKCVPTFPTPSPSPSPSP